VVQGVGQLICHFRNRANVSEFAKPSPCDDAKRAETPPQRRMDSKRFAAVVDTEAR
jgi:hypothetical protein